MAPHPIGDLNVSSQIGVILPTYCEEQNIGRLIAEIENLRLSSSVLVIDDSSPDKTAEIVKGLQTKHHDILLLVRPVKSGLGSAITDGFKIFLSLKNPPKSVVTLDADYSHNPKDIPRLCSSIQDGYGVVIGSRYCKGGKVAGWPFTRRVVSRIANVIAKSTLGLKPNDCTSGFRCYSTRFLRTTVGNLHSTTYEIQIETVKQASLQGFGVREIPVLFVNRKRGKSKLTIAEIRSYVSYVLGTIWHRHSQ